MVDCKYSYLIQIICKQLTWNHTNACKKNKKKITLPLNNPTRNDMRSNELTLVINTSTYQFKALASFFGWWNWLF